MWGEAILQAGVGVGAPAYPRVLRLPWPSSRGGGLSWGASERWGGKSSVSCDLESKLRDDEIPQSPEHSQL